MNFGPGIKEFHYQPKDLKPGARKALSAPLPTSWDWRSHGGVSPAKSQSPHDLCWLFATVGAAEALVKLGDGLSSYPDYSENDVRQGNPHGLTQQGGYHRVVANHLTMYGTINESANPYTSIVYSSGPVPNYWNPPKGTPGKSARSWRELGNLNQVSDADTLKRVIYDEGPLVCYMDTAIIDQWSQDRGLTRFYSSLWNGNLVVPVIESSTYDHAVLICGWDDNKTHYGSTTKGAWLVKNSWGTTWGDNGFFWIAYGSANMGNSAGYFPRDGFADYNADETLMYYDELGCFSYTGYYNDYDVYALCAFTPVFSGEKYLNTVEFWSPQSNIDYEITVFDTWDRSGQATDAFNPTTSGSVVDAGYYTVEMKPGIPLESGDEIYIQVRFTDPNEHSYWLIPRDINSQYFPNDMVDETDKCYVSRDGATAWSRTAWISTYGDIGIRGRYSSDIKYTPVPVTPTPTSCSGVEDWVEYQ